MMVQQDTVILAKLQPVDALKAVCNNQEEEPVTFNSRGDLGHKGCQIL